MPISPESSTSWQVNSFAIAPSALVALGAIVITFAGTIGYVLIAIALGAIHRSEIAHVSAIQSVIAQLFAYALVVPYLLVTIPRLAHRSLAELGVRAPTPFALAVGVAGAIAMVVTVNLAGSIIVDITHDHTPESALVLLAGLRGSWQICTFAALATVFAPLVEELFFRVLVFNAFERYVPTIAAAVASGILFGVTHVTAMGQLLTLAIPLALGGIVLAFVYARTRCYWANWLTHALFNSTTLFAYFVAHVKP